MASRLEAADEDWVAERALRFAGVFSVHLFTDGNTGWPDRIYFIRGGRPLLIEHKRESISGDGRSARQRLIHARLKAAGYDVQTHYSRSTALQAVLDAASLSAKGGQVPRTAPSRRTVAGSRDGQD